MRCLAFLALAVLMTAAAPPIVHTRDGTVQGTTEGAVAVYRGIPYAASPVGPNRWRAPQPATRWSGIRSATAFGHSCWQAVAPAGFGPWTHEYVVAGDISEDCLFLNVWTPLRRTATLPVLVWVHGGGFNSGSGAIPIYDGARLAAGGAVVVTINYRVGVFGFLQHPELTREAAGGPVGNFGLQDIIAALRWVRANARAFGGDAARVTVAGQSAGAMAVQELVASPSAQGLFAQAIAESGLPRPLPPLAAAETQGTAFAREKGAASLAALRAMPAEALQPSHGSNAIRFVPVADGVLLSDRQWRATSDVPTLAGFTADEGSALGQDYGSADPGKLATYLRDAWGSAAGRVAALYPGDPAEANRQAHRDRGLADLLLWARTRAATARTPVYAYQFAYREPGPEAARWGAFHSSEIPYAFGTLGAAPERGFTAADRALSVRVQCWWLAFVKTGRPDCEVPPWPALDLERPALMRIDTVPQAVPVLAPAKLALIPSTP